MTCNTQEVEEAGHETPNTTQGSQVPTGRVQGPWVLKIWIYTGFETADSYNVASVGTTAEGQLYPGHLRNASNAGLRGKLICQSLR